MAQQSECQDQERPDVPVDGWVVREKPPQGHSTRDIYFRGGAKQPSLEVIPP